MKIPLRIAFLSAALAALMLPGVAQTQSGQAPTSTNPPDPGANSNLSVKQRKQDQQQRVANGVASGQMTAGEASKVESQEHNINQEERDMRQQDNGHLTAADKASLKQQQNQVSGEIYQDKHNAATQGTPKTEVGRRAQNQQERISQGVASGKLNAAQTSHLESEEAGINKEKREDRAANGGKLTQQEKSQINKQQNHVSKQIYRDKHKGK